MLIAKIQLGNKEMKNFSMFAFFLPVNGQYTLKVRYVEADLVND
jgi:hypothetical protein